MERRPAGRKRFIKAEETPAAKRPCTRHAPFEEEYVQSVIQQAGLVGSTSQRAALRTTYNGFREGFPANWTCGQTVVRSLQDKAELMSLVEHVKVVNAKEVYDEYLDALACEYYYGRVAGFLGILGIFRKTQEMTMERIAACIRTLYDLKDCMEVSDRTNSTSPVSFLPLRMDMHPDTRAVIEVNQQMQRRHMDTIGNVLRQYTANGGAEKVVEQVLTSVKASSTVSQSILNWIPIYECALHYPEYSTRDGYRQLVMAVAWATRPGALAQLANQDKKLQQ